MSAIRVPRSTRFFLFCLLVASNATYPGDASETLARSDVRILFLGDSITAAGVYVNEIETAVLLRQGRQEVPQIVALGLSSETASGLSEKSHPFPRPTVHERLDRVLRAVQPTVVVACYGINDGIYQPFSEERFAAYRDGIRQLIRKVHDAGARIVLLTPPPYAGKMSTAPAAQDDSEYDYRIPFPAYDSVMARYADWIMTLEKEDDVETIDIRTPMLAAIEASYGKDPIHPNAYGHRVMATAVLANWGRVMSNEGPVDLAKLTEEDERWPELHALVSNRRKVYDGKLLWEIGHQRPGDVPAMTLEDAKSEATEIDEQIANLLVE